MQQSTCCVLPSQRCLQGNENAITFWVNKVITFCVKYCYILSCTIKFCFKNSYILHHYYILWRHSVSQRNVLWNVEKMQAAPWTLLLLVFLIKLSCRRSEFFIIWRQRCSRSSMKRRNLKTSIITSIVRPRTLWSTWERMRQLDRSRSKAWTTYKDWLTSTINRV